MSATTPGSWERIWLRLVGDQHISGGGESLAAADTSNRTVSKEDGTMSEFTYLFRGGLSSASPDQRQKHMERWVAWFKELGEKGVISDPRNPPGHPLEAGGKVVRGTQKSVTDGPYAEAKDIVGGYIL